MDIQTILVVDDSVVQCNFAVGLCKHLLPDARVSFAHNGKAALELLKLEPVTLLLVDLEMPVMDGVELLAQVSDLQLASAAIVLSGQDSSIISSVATMARAKGLQVLGSLQKPLDETRLSAALKQYKDLQRQYAKASVSALALKPEDIQKGIEHCEFICHFQPKLTAGTLLVKGVEALARWNHPNYGFISPAQFIPLAEESHLIDALSVHLFEFALARRQEWQQKGLKLALAFNISPNSLQDTQLVAKISSTAEKYNASPKDITLEITENALLANLGESLQTLARLRLLGFQISIDDYGTGFANTEQLSLIPATELKLDRSMVHDVHANPQQEIILRSTVNLAKELNLSTVAEGVEVYEDYKKLKELHVDLIQGFYFSRPLAADTLVAWIHSDLNVIRDQINNSSKH